MNNKTKLLMSGGIACVISAASYTAVKRYKAYSEEKSKKFAESLEKAFQEAFESLEGKI